MPVRFAHWLRAFAPAPVGASLREKCYGALGALLGLLCTAWIARLALGQASPWFIPPMGASAVLLFAVPASPLAQPWSILGGNVVSALIGVVCARYIPDVALAAAAAGGLAIAAMFALRCLHPPGGAVALTAVLGGPAVSQLGFGFAIWPVGINSLALLCVAVMFNGLLKRPYPKRTHDTPRRMRPATHCPVNAWDFRPTTCGRRWIRTKACWISAPTISRTSSWPPRPAPPHAGMPRCNAPISCRATSCACRRRTRWTMPRR
ncbi:HPP family protein [Bordetella holmesii 41130]|nr:HPP family protein [Bordetella holmesii 41130]